MSALAARPALAALAGFSFALPFLLMNLVVANRVEPMNGWIRGAGLNDATGFGPGFFMVLALLLPLPLGAIVALRPALHRGADGRRRWPIIGIVVGGLLLAGFLAVGFGLGQDVYRCDVLRISNCD